MPGVLASNLAISDMMKRKAGITCGPQSARTRHISPVRTLRIARVMSVMGIHFPDPKNPGIFPEVKVLEIR